MSVRNKRFLTRLFSDRLQSATAVSVLLETNLVRPAVGAAHAESMWLHTLQTHRCLGSRGLQRLFIGTRHAQFTPNNQAVLSSGLSCIGHGVIAQSGPDGVAQSG